MEKTSILAPMPHYFKPWKVIVGEEIKSAHKSHRAALEAAKDFPFAWIDYRITNKDTDWGKE